MACWLVHLNPAKSSTFCQCNAAAFIRAARVSTVLKSALTADFRARPWGKQGTAALACRMWCS